MSKRIVICCDGTWNTPAQQSPTNVTKVALAVARADHHGGEQRTFYHRGVGFSRGAFTARSTAGLIHNCGVLRRPEIDRIDEAYALYRSRLNDARPHGVESTLFRRSYSYEPRIHFIGVWDTVGALGIPIDGLPFARWLNRRWGFHDTALSGSVDAGIPGPRHRPGRSDPATGLVHRCALRCRRRQPGAPAQRYSAVVDGFPGAAVGAGLPARGVPHDHRNAFRNR